MDALDGSGFCGLDEGRRSDIRLFAASPRIGCCLAGLEERRRSDSRLFAASPCFDFCFSADDSADDSDEGDAVGGGDSDAIDDKLDGSGFGGFDERRSSKMPNKLALLLVLLFDRGCDLVMDRRFDNLALSAAAFTTAPSI